MVEIGVRFASFLLLTLLLFTIGIDLFNSDSLQKLVDEKFPASNDNSTEIYKTTHSLIYYMKKFTNATTFVVSLGISSLIALSPVCIKFKILLRLLYIILMLNFIFKNRKLGIRRCTFNTQVFWPFQLR